MSRVSEGKPQTRWSTSREPARLFDPSRQLMRGPGQRVSLLMWHQSAMSSVKSQAGPSPGMSGKSFNDRVVSLDARLARCMHNLASAHPCPLRAVTFVHRLCQTLGGKVICIDCKSHPSTPSEDMDYPASCLQCQPGSEGSCGLDIRG